MKFKNISILLLLTILTVHFICPVLCSVSVAKSCLVPAADSLWSQPQVQDSSSNCCHSQQLPQEDQGKGSTRCCLTQLTFVNSNKYRVPVQLTKVYLSFAGSIPIHPTILNVNSCSVLHLRCIPPLSKELFTNQFLSRAPPVFLS
jgi:hypothetical protein